MLRGRLQVLSAALLFGTTGTARALGASGASPVAVGTARVLLGALALLVLAGPGPLVLLGRRSSWLAGAAVAAYQPAFFLAVSRTGVAVGTVVALGSAPLLTGALGWACGLGRPGRRWAGATGCAGVGLAVLVGGGDRVRPVGVLLALAAGAAYAGYTVTLKRVLDGGADPTAAMASAFVTAAVWLCPVLVLVPFGWATTAAGAATALWLGVVPTALAYLMFVRGLRVLAAEEVSTLTLAEPVTAALLGVLVLGEPVTPRILAGGILILAGLAILAVPRRRIPAAGSPGGAGTGRSATGSVPGAPGTATGRRAAGR